MQNCLNYGSNILPSGGREDVKEAAASIDAARSDDVRRNPTDTHQRRPLRGRSLAKPSKPLYRCTFYEGAAQIRRGGEQQVISGRFRGPPRPTSVCSPPRPSSEGAHWRRSATGACSTKRFPGF